MDADATLRALSAELERARPSQDGRPRLVHVQHLPARPADTVALPRDLAEPLPSRLELLGVRRLYRHQAEARAHVSAGRHVIVSTGTASGKSLCYQLPLVERLLCDPKASALYLAPTKALARDQVRALRAFRLPQIRAAAYDGDTPAAEREAVRRTANVVLTNPDMLHVGLLPGHRRWGDFLHRLTLVVVDECHVARGVFGSHVAAILRRLRRVCEAYRSAPTFVLASATIGNPTEHARNLTGCEVAEVVGDGSPRPPVTFALWEPPLTDARSGARRSTLAETAEVLAGIVERGPAAIAFVKSRKGAELVASHARRCLHEGTLAGDADPGRVGFAAASETVAGDANPDGDGVDADRGSVVGDANPGGSGSVADTMTGTRAAAHAPRILAYRAGYLPEERRAVERGLLDGSVRAVAATDALELGVDVGSLDAVVIAGWPGTAASLWQQAGRAGRRDREALAVFVAADNPLDHYLLANPSELFGRPLESAVVDVTNPYVLLPHLRCAAWELPLEPGGGPGGLAGADGAGVEAFGVDVGGLVAEEVAAGRLRERSGRYFWSGRGSPAAQVSIRSVGGEPFLIVDADTGALIGDVDEARAYRTVHTGAVYLHQGWTYRVEHLDLASRTAAVRAYSGEEYTVPRTDTDVAVRSVAETADWGRCRMHRGRVEIGHQVLAYERRRAFTNDVLGLVELDLPRARLVTQALWLTVPDEVLAAAGLPAPRVPGAAHAAEHAAIGLLPLFAMCDRWDIGGLSTAWHPDTGMATIFIYDGYPGGAGISERGFRSDDAHLRATLAAIAGCRCASGCPSCVQSPKCGNGNSPLDKAGAVALLEAVLGERAAAAGAVAARVSRASPDADGRGGPRR